jgi:hypothetical protein
MSDEVGVDVERIGQLASALENLRDVLAANVPTIVNTMNSYWSSGTGSPISLQPLTQAEPHSVDDATDIRDRATMAVAYQNRPNPTLSGNMVEIPWVSGTELATDSAQAAAQNLAAAEAESAKNPKAARAQIQAIQAEIKDNLDSLDDPDSGATAWLGSFYNTAAPQVANLAATLNGEDGQTMVNMEPAILTTQDQQILNTFATGLASADKSGTLTNISGYAKAANLWSVGMLFKFGPSGSAYGTQETGTPNLLAQVTTSIELARTKLNGYTIPLNGPNVSTGAWGADFVTQSLAEFDPSQAMLTLATQNGAAAREVLADKTNGPTIAAALMNSPTTSYTPLFSSNGTLEGFTNSLMPVQYQGGTPINFNEPMYAGAHPVTLSANVIGSFFNAATDAPRGIGQPAEDSAYAAMHIIDSTPPPSTAQLAAPVQAALLATAQRYMLDLGNSTGNTNSNKSTVQNLLGNSNYPYTIDIAHDVAANVDPLANFLQQITSNPTDDGTLMASAKTMFTQYYGLKATGKLPSPLNSGDPAYFMSKLMGQIQTQSNNVGIQGAEATDAQHAEYNALLSFAESEVTKIPVVGAPLGDAQTAAGLMGINLPSFSTNNAATAYASDQQSFAIEQLQLNVPMVQALLHAHVISPPSTSAGENNWYQNGTINLKNSTDVDEFNNWYTSVVSTKTATGTLEGDLTTYQNAMGLEQSSSLTPVSGS